MSHNKLENAGGHASNIDNQGLQITATDGRFALREIAELEPREDQDSESAGLSWEHARNRDNLCLELQIFWGDNVLRVVQVRAPQGFSIGSDVAADFVVAEDLLEQPSWEILSYRDGSYWLSVPAALRAWATRRENSNDVKSQSLKFLPPGEYELKRQLHAGAVLQLGQVVISIRWTQVARSPARGLFAARDFTSLAYFGLSLAVHGALVALMAFFIPKLAGDEIDESDSERLYLMQAYLKSAAEREDATAGSTGEPAAAAHEPNPGEPGKAGTPSPRSDQRPPAARPAPAAPHSDREKALQAAATFGMAGLLQMHAQSEPTLNPWGAPGGPGGVDGLDALWSDGVGDGVGGARLSGPGDGGGGKGMPGSVGLRGIGTREGGNGGDRDGTGRGVGNVGAQHFARAVQLRPEPMLARGQLPSEVIQRTVRQNYGRFRMCYERALLTNPDLRGRISARFVIDREGAVTSVSDGGSDIPDGKLVSCVLSTFYGLSFPKPESGIVTVVYPLTLTPG